jgi:hypothetical protein
MENCLSGFRQFIESGDTKGFSAGADPTTRGLIRPGGKYRPPSDYDDTLNLWRKKRKLNFSKKCRK